MTEGKIKEVKDRYINFRVTQTVYESLEKMVHSFGSEELKKARGNKANLMAKSIIERYISPFIISRATEEDDYKQILKLERALKDGLKFQERIYKKVIDGIGKERLKLEIRKDKG